MKYLFCLLFVVGCNSNLVTKEDAIRYNSRDNLRSQLRNPDSLEIISEERVGNDTRIKFRAENGFGGTSIEEGIY